MSLHPVCRGGGIGWNLGLDWRWGGGWEDGWLDGWDGWMDRWRWTALHGDNLLPSVMHPLDSDVNEHGTVTLRNFTANMLAPFSPYCINMPLMFHSDTGLFSCTSPHNQCL